MKQRYFSNIYWHFTGSPRNIDWGLCRCPKDILELGKPRRPKDSLETLFAILESKKLLASCTEKISKRIHTDPFCCVTDIPLMDLSLHSRYYGKVVIGFNCPKIHRLFNPVLYYPSKRFPRKIHIPPPYGEQLIVDDFDNIDTEWYDVEELPNGKFKLTRKGRQLRFQATEIDSSKIDRYFINHLKITDFSHRNAESFYQEREWRKIGDLYFDRSDVEAVIIPKRLKNITEKFILGTEDFKDLTILTWEFINMV